MRKADLKRRIYELDFAIHELVLFLDSHATSRRAMELLEEYRRKRMELIKVYEENFGAYINTVDNVTSKECWEWLKGPWPWENDFMEG